MYYINRFTFYDIRCLLILFPSAATVRDIFDVSIATQFSCHGFVTEVVNSHCHGHQLT